MRSDSTGGPRSSSNNDLFGPDSTALGARQSFRCTRFGVTCDDGGATPETMNQVGVKGQCHGSTGSPYMDDVQPYADFVRGLKPNPYQLVIGSSAGTTEAFQVDLRALSSSPTPLPALGHSCSSRAR